MGTHEYEFDTRNEEILIYVNGEIVPRNEAKVSVFDSGFLLGDGVWEGIRYHNKKLVHKDEHFRRLFESAAAIGMDIGKTETELEEIIISTLAANNMESDIHIRFIVSRGLKKTPHQHPNVNVSGPTIVVIPEYKIASEDVKKKGIRLGTVSVRRGTSKTQDPKWNTLSKMNCIVACIEADRLGFDEGLMLDMHGNVSTCNSTNFFIVRQGEVWTSTGEYCLNGVTRGSIIRLCKENDIPVFERNFHVEDCHSADEAFVTGTFAGVIPVVEMDGHEISGGKRGALTERLQDIYKKDINSLYPPSD
ncbi:MAG TPA: aminotransferase class IV [Candidatus Marinimicrobia bacterium]|jgi:branched-chain amino acid aminotransferase|nr:aminotransferase class IV [Candidatus Neomarinimicrobiota bacterium]